LVQILERYVYSEIAKVMGISIRAVEGESTELKKSLLQSGNFLTVYASSMKDERRFGFKTHFSGEYYIKIILRERRS